MTCSTSIGGIVAVGLLAYLVRGAPEAGGVLVTAQRVPAARALPRRPSRAGQAARALHGAGLRGACRPASIAPRAGSSASSTGSRGVRPDRGDGVEDLRVGDAALQLRGPARRLPAPALQGGLPLNPQGLGAVTADSSFNTAVSFATNTNWQGYGGETTMSYLTQMLGLTVQNFVSAAGGHGHPRRVRARLLAPLGGDHREFLGGSHADDALHPAAALVRARARLGFAGCGPDLRRVREGRGRPADPVRRAGDRQGRQAGPRREGPAQDDEDDPERADPGPRPRRVPDRHQAARDERRRLLQRQLGPSVRERDAAVELPRAARDPGDLRRALLHVRRHGRRHPPGLGRARGDDCHLRRPPRRLRGGRAARRHARPGSGSTTRRATSRPAATWRARRSASGSRTPRSGRPRPRPPRTAP